MNTLVAFLAAAEPASPAATWYSPGVIGFIATFGVTAAAVALIFDMVRRVRRVRYRAEIQAKIDAEQQTSTKAKPAPAARAKPAKPATPAKPKRD
jgi:hypothetical protein